MLWMTQVVFCLLKTLSKVILDLGYNLEYYICSTTKVVKNSSFLKMVSI